MAAPGQPIPNGGIPIMPGGGLIYQQPPVVMAGGHHQVQYAPRKPYIPRERHPNEEQCKLFVGAVSKDTSEEHLRAYFSKFGEIADSVIMLNKQTREPRGFAFVTFKDPGSVQAVLEQNNNGGHTLDGKVYLQVRKYFPKAEYDAEKNNINPSANPQGRNNWNDNNGGQYNNGFQYKGPMKVTPDLKIFVGGIGIGTTEDDVRKYFEQFGGKVLRVDMPRDGVTKQRRGFAFVGFDKKETVQAICQDRYHQINGKTVEVKGADEQQEHMKKKQEAGYFTVPSAMGIGRGQAGRPQQIQPGSIATVQGYGAYANLAAAPQQVVIPQGTQYAVQMPAATAGGYVFDPATNTYYQLPGAVVGAPQAANPYAGLTVVGAAGQQVIAAPHQLQPGVITAEMMQQVAGQTAIGAVYPNETSMVGPQRTHLVGAAGQQRVAGNQVADPHVVYSTSASISAGEGMTTPRGFHPYGR